MCFYNLKNVKILAFVYFDCCLEGFVTCILHLFIHSFSKGLLNAYYVPGIVLGSRLYSTQKQTKIPVPGSLYSSEM